MLLARVSFIPHHDHEEAELVAVAEAYLGSMLKHGQICGEYVKGWSDGALQAYVRLSHRTAAHHKYLSDWGRRNLAAVKLQYGAEPVWEILDDDVSVRIPTWKSATSLYLFTHVMTADSPVRHGDRGSALPVHLLPLNDRLREDIFFWNRSYRRHDGLWLDGGALEMSSYRQLSDPSSHLSESGRSVCGAIEKLVGKPVFYYLLQHFGDLATADDRPCPDCGQPWRCEKSPMPSTEPFHNFHFRCESCRLVSHRAVVFDEGESEDAVSASPLE